MIDDMTKENEIDRLDRLGREQAKKAGWDRRYAMGAPGSVSATARAANGLHHMPVTGRIAMSVGGFLVLLILATALGVPATPAVIVAVVVWAAAEGGHYRMRRRKLAKLKDRVTDAQMTLHKLRQQELQIDVEKAKASGAFDRFEEK